MALPTRLLVSRRQWSAVRSSCAQSGSAVEVSQLNVCLWSSVNLDAGVCTNEKFRDRHHRSTSDFWPARSMKHSMRPGRVMAWRDAAVANDKVGVYDDTGRAFNGFPDVFPSAQSVLHFGPAVARQSSASERLRQAKCVVQGFEAGALALTPSGAHLIVARFRATYIGGMVPARKCIRIFLAKASSRTMSADRDRSGRERRGASSHRCQRDR
jgi:hypothetical protein